MNQFQSYIPTCVLFGEGQLMHLHEKRLPGKKALIVISEGQTVRRYGYLERLEKELDLADVAYAVFDKVRSNPTRANVMDGVRAVKASGCDFVIALGGGSVIDCSKCIALMAMNEGDIWDYSLSAAGGKRVPQFEALPTVAITTSAGTGSEVNMAAVISDDARNEKTAFRFTSMFPAIAVVDPSLMVSVPPKLTAYQGMDAFFHASESMINNKRHPLSELFALKAIELIAHALPIAYRDGGNEVARAEMALGSTLAGYYMFCTSGHRIEHVMGSYHPNLIHGAGLIMTAHAYYAFFAGKKATEEAMIKMAKAMGIANAASGADFVTALDHLIAAIDCADLKMSDAGIGKEELQCYPRKIHEVLGGDITADPLLLRDRDYLEIYERAYR